MTLRELIIRLEMLDQSADILIGGEPGPIEEVVQIDTHTVVLLGATTEDGDDENDE